eukprot:TRINITY_DN29473_c0_g1_i1.p1 TRINITY_DN29473_c0_g1~~TRINITY_DN29473_c0_g1_i1.p1  ORF type:complete len:153 (-),score=33.95 TRINITY_DN29473_c0_g1_i1:212-670(-)
MIRRPPRSTLSSSSAASDVYKRQLLGLGLEDMLVGNGALEAAGIMVDNHVLRTAFENEQRSWAMNPVPPPVGELGLGPPCLADLAGDDDQGLSPEEHSGIPNPSPNPNDTPAGSSLEGNQVELSDFLDRLERSLTPGATDSDWPEHVIQDAS